MVTLVVRDPVLTAVATRQALAVPGVTRLHEQSVLHSALHRSRDRGVDVARNGERPVVTVRLVVRRVARVIEVVRTVQRSVRDELLRTTGVDADVVVVVVDLD